MKTVSITHLTSAHPRYDTRIFVKECCSLAKIMHYDVSLIVADGKGDENSHNVTIIDVGLPTGGRISRMKTSTNKVFLKAKELDSALYHLHDPELIPIGLKLKKMGYKVIFDVHENTSLQIKNKEYLPRLLRTFISYWYALYEKKVLKTFDYLVLAEHSYYTYYVSFTKELEIILNMPDLIPLKPFQNTQRDKNELFYIGGISNDRGLDVTLKAIEILKKSYPDIFMHYIGPIYNPNDKLNNKHIKFYGSMPLLKGMEYSIHAKVGLSILKPIENYMSSYSTKIFEYMAIGLPVVTSNFDLYKDVIIKHHCGLCVDPTDSNKIAEAISYIIQNPHEAKIMGENGILAAHKYYNWTFEEEKLLALYKKLLS